MLEKTLVIIKPGAIQRALVGTVFSRFEHKGLRIAGVKMLQLTENILKEHYSHLTHLPFYPKIVNSMTECPVVVLCLEGVEAVSVVRAMAGVTNGREAMCGTIRGDFSMSNRENIIHASDSLDNAKIEIDRFFAPTEIFDYQKNNWNFINSIEEIQQ